MTKRALNSAAFILALANTLAATLCAQDTPPSNPAPAPAKLSQEALEAKFKATMTKATLSGRWCGIKDGKLTPEKEDKYTIVSVNKLGGDTWIIHTRIQYGEKDFTVPLPIQVKWAGDTPVITVDGMTSPAARRLTPRACLFTTRPTPAHGPAAITPA